MKLPVSIASKLVLMQGGEKVPFSTINHPVIGQMIENGILTVQIKGRTKKQVSLSDKELLGPYLLNHLGIDNLEKYISGYQKSDLRRSEAIEISSGSKLKRIRTFKGFLVNCYQPVKCELNGSELFIEPRPGTFTFIYDFETFIPSSDTTIVGIENPENFRYIGKQKQLFGNIRPLFVSRYPQNSDLVRWLVSIPNDYLHFGDFDFAGLNIYCNEYKKHLKAKARFFLPPGIERLLSDRGNRDNYNNQTLQFEPNLINEDNVLILLKLIEKYRKGLEQELLIQSQRPLPD